MSSLVQVTTNRQNAQKSTGPKSLDGKKRASQNAMLHGLRSNQPVLPSENADDWEQHRLGVIVSLDPVGTLEMGLAERVASCLWRLNRIVNYETIVVAISQTEAEEDLKQKDRSNDELSFTTKSDTSKLREVETQLKNQTDLQQYWERVHRVVESLKDLPDETLVEGDVADGVLMDLNGAIPQADEESIDFEDPDTLLSLGLPKEAWKSPNKWEGWTVAILRKVWHLIATEFKLDPEQLLQQAIKDGRDSLNEQAQSIRDLSKKAKKYRNRIADRVRRMQLRRMIPDQPTMDKITRYEAHLTRQMLQATQTLERLQASRKGAEVPPPASVHVVVDLPTTSNP